MKNTAVGLVCFVKMRGNMGPKYLQEAFQVRVVFSVVFFSFTCGRFC